MDPKAIKRIQAITKQMEQLQKEMLLILQQEEAKRLKREGLQKQGLG
jgi:hypothetical protein